MILALVPLALVVAVVVGIVVVVQRRGQAGDGSNGITGHSVRRFFHYLLLAGLLFAAATGVAGLFGRVLDPSEPGESIIISDDSLLALQLTLTAVALPLWLGLGWWTLRRLRSDPGEARSVTWAAYLTLVGIVSLLVAMTAWHEALTVVADRLTGTAGTGGWSGSSGSRIARALARAVVWTGVWGVHLWWGARVTRPSHLRVERLLGALIGLGTAAVGLADTLTPALRELVGLSGQSLLDRTLSDVLEGAALLLVGGLAWAVYWVLSLSRGERDTGWLAYVLLAGVGAGLLTAVGAASALLYTVLVWLVGSPASRDVLDNFSGAPRMLALVLVGLLVWWYHQEVLGTRRARERTEVRRVYEYLMAAVGLAAAGSGLVMVLVTIVEAIAAGRDLVVGGSALNALLGAVVLLGVGLPVWWWHWRRAQGARSRHPDEEVASPARRFYLLVLFGLMGIAAVVALITLVYLVLDDVLAGGVDAETLRRIRFPLGILVTTSLLSAYHWTVFRADRDVVPEMSLAGGRAADTPVDAPVEAPVEGHRRRTALVVAPSGGTGDDGDVSALASQLQERSGFDVQVLRRTDAGPAPWSVDELAALLATSDAADVLVIADDGDWHVIPVER